MTADAKTTLLPAARLAEMRAFASAVPPASEWEATIIGHALALLRHLDALAAPADGEDERAHVDAGKPSERARANANTREQRVQRLAKIAGELLQIGEDTVSEYLARDAEIARLTEARNVAEARAGSLAADLAIVRELEAEALASMDRWKMIAEGKDVRIAGLREEIARLTAELADVRSQYEIECDAHRGTCDKHLAAVARARREGARDEREAIVEEAKTRGFYATANFIRTRARGDAAPVEGEDGAT